MDVTRILSSLDLIQDEVVMKTNADKDQMKVLMSEFNNVKFQLKEYIENEQAIDIQGVNEDKMDFFDWLNAPEYAQTTFLPFLDPHFQWKRGYANAWTGYSGEGKSTLLYFLLLIQVIKDDAPIAVFSPENFPRNRFVKDWVTTIIGENPKLASRSKVEKAISMFNDKLFYVYPKKHDYDSIEEQFRGLIKSEGVKYTVIDPFLKVKKPSGMSDLQYLADFMQRNEQFAKEQNVCHNVVYHQKTPQLNEETGNYPKPNKYTIKGGGNITDGSDAVLAVHRPLMVSDPEDTTVDFSTQKYKENEIAKPRGWISLQYKPSSNRYTYMGKDLFEMALKNKDFKTNLFE